MTQFNFSSKNVLHVAVAAAFGVAAVGGAQATVNLNAGTGTVKVAKETASIVLAHGNSANQFDIALAGPAGIAPSSVDPTYIRINLATGVTFKTADPTLQCLAATAGAATAINAVKQGGGLGFNYVTFSIQNSAVQTGSYFSGDCTLTVNAAGLTLSAGVAGTDLVVSARTEYKDGASYTTAYLSDKAYVTYVKGVSASVSAASAVVVDATSGSDNFATASDLGIQTAAVFGRYFAYGSGVSTSAVLGTADTTHVSATDVYTAVGVTVTVSGAPLAAGLAANSSAGVFLATAGSIDCSAGNSTGVFSSTANGGTTVTFTGIANTTIVSGVILCMNVNGGTGQIATGAVYIGANEGNVANVTTTLGGMKLLTTVSTNGVTKNAYIVHAPTSTSKTTQLWMKNTGATAGPVYATCYGASGAIVGTSNSLLVSSLAVNQLTSKTSSDIFTAIGYTTGYAATDKVSCVLNAALAGLELINQTKDLAGNSITITQSQTN